jgi:hypothetical protein
MSRTPTVRALAYGGAFLLLFVADISPDAPLGVSLGRQAHALVGVPFSPVSVAGVARRTTRRVVAVEATTATAAVATTSAQQQATAQQQAATAQQQAATAQQQAATAQQQAAKGAAPAVGTIVSSLPAGCAQETKSGVQYQKCGGVYYRAAFQGNNLVYVSAQP